MDSKKKFEDSVCATSVGQHADKALLCRQSSSAQVDQNILQSDMISTAKGSCEDSSGEEGPGGKKTTNMSKKCFNMLH